MTIDSIEQAVKCSRSAYYYCSVSGIRNSKVEAVIAQSPLWSCRYAKNVLKGRFVIGEEIIAKHPDYALEYVKDVVKDKWGLGEEMMKTDKYVWKDYCEFLNSVSKKES